MRRTPPSDGEHFRSATDLETPDTNSVNENKTPDADWLTPSEEQPSLERYLETIRERLWLIVVTVFVTTGLAVAYVATAPKTYEADADLLITPADSGNPVYGSLGLIQGSADPSRDVETASRLVTNIEVARTVVAKLDIDKAPEYLLNDVQALPVAQSMIVAITATADTPAEAKELADGFAQGAVEHRTTQMHQQIDQQLPRLIAQAEVGGELIDETAESQINQMRLLRTGPDPTMRVESLAVEPSVQASPRPVLSVAAGLFAGLMLGIGGAFGAQALDPKLRRESQLRHAYRIPILGRIPRETGNPEDEPIEPRSLSPAAAESYRTLRTTLTGSRGKDRAEGKVIFVTGSGASEGKTTTALNLATSTAVAGRRVIVIEADLRRPVIGKAFGAGPNGGGVVSVLLENTTLTDSLVQVETYGPSLKLLLADYEGGWITELFSIPTAAELIAEARRLADVVIIDSAPLNDVVDALPLAQLADDILIVTRLGVTRLDRLEMLGELLAENGIKPVGFTVIGTPRPKRSEYHYYRLDSDSSRRRKLRLPRSKRTAANRGSAKRSGRGGAGTS